MTLNPRFSIVVPTFRRPEALRETLRSLLSLDYESSDYEVIVIDDDGGGDVTPQIVSELKDGRVELTLDSQQRRGAAAARNRGARRASGDLLLFCDDDILVGPQHLRLHLAAREGHADPIVNGAWEFTPEIVDLLRQTPFGRFRLKLEQDFRDGVGGEPCGDGTQRMRLLGSWDLALRRELFWELKGFDEDFPVAGAEDQDFSLRARTAGCELLLDKKIVCLHNDNRLSLAAYCAREERSAQTMPILARKYPDELLETPYIRENRPVARADPPRLMLKKGVKALLATRPALGALHRLTNVSERLRMPESLLRRLYRLLLGLHLYRGFRRSWR